jgi:hypothetical protein
LLESSHYSSDLHVKEKKVLPPRPTKLLLSLQEFRYLGTCLLHLRQQQKQKHRIQPFRIGKEEAERTSGQRTGQETSLAKISSSPLRASESSDPERTEKHMISCSCSRAQQAIGVHAPQPYVNPSLRRPISPDRADDPPPSALAVQAHSLVTGRPRQGTSPQRRKATRRMDHLYIDII